MSDEIKIKPLQSSDEPPTFPESGSNLKPPQPKKPVKSTADGGVSH